MDARAGALPGSIQVWGCLRPCSCLVDSLRLCLCVPVGTTPPSGRPSILRLCSLVRSRVGSPRGDVKRRCHVSALAVASRACRLSSHCAERFFRWTGDWGFLVSLIQLSGFLCGLRNRLAAPSSGLAQRPRRRHDRPETRGRCPGPFLYFPFHIHSRFAVGTQVHGTLLFPLVP